MIGGRARLAPDVSIGPFAVIEDDVVLGAGTAVRAHAVVKRFTELGAGNVVHEGAIVFPDGREVASLGLAELGKGDTVTFAAKGAARVLLIAGRPIKEPVAWHGPFVMNTRDELVQAFEDYQAGRF